MNVRSFTHCDACGFEYKARTARWVYVLSDPRTEATLMLCVAVVLFGAAVLVTAPLDAASHFFRLVSFDPRDARQVGVHVARAWSDRCDAMASGVVGLGLIGVGGALKTAYARNRNMGHEWLLSLCTAFFAHDI